MLWRENRPLQDAQHKVLRGSHLRHTENVRCCSIDLAALVFLLREYSRRRPNKQFLTPDDPAGQAIANGHGQPETAGLALPSETLEACSKPATV